MGKPNVLGVIILLLFSKANAKSIIENHDRIESSGPCVLTMGDSSVMPIYPPILTDSFYNWVLPTKFKKYTEKTLWERVYDPDNHEESTLDIKTSGVIEIGSGEVVHMSCPGASFQNNQINGEFVTARFVLFVADKFDS